MRVSPSIIEQLYSQLRMTTHRYQGAVRLVYLIAILSILVACGENRNRIAPTYRAEMDSPQDVARAFFDVMRSSESDVFDDEFMSLYFTDDFVPRFRIDRMYLEGLSFGSAKLAFDEPVDIDGDYTFLKVEVRTAEGIHQTSLVVFLKHEPTWKIDDIRRLFPPASVAFVRRNALKATSDLSPQEQRELQHLERAYLTDDELIEAFRQNKARFVDVQEQFHSQDKIELICRDWLDQYLINDRHQYKQADEVERTLVDNRIEKSSFDRFAEALDQLEIECIERDSLSHIRFLKVGVLDYSVWYVYAPDGNLPWDKMTSGGPFIEPIDKHWYLFREPIKRLSNK